MPGPLTKLTVENFTAFSAADLPLSPGINVLLGANATGKTHLLKLLYTACDITRSKTQFAGKLVSVFHPYQHGIGRLVRRTGVSTRARASVARKSSTLSIEFSNHTTSIDGARVLGSDRWVKDEITCAYLPVKEFLAHAPGFRSLYQAREIEFEEVYADLIDRAYLPALKGPPGTKRRRLLEQLRKVIEGRVIVKGETFFLKTRQGELEFHLVAEGLRKLALIWLLVQNGTLLKGAALFWDEPEANLNPAAIGSVASVLLELQREGVQIFLATHDYVLLKELELAAQPTDDLAYFGLSRDGTGAVAVAKPVARFSEVDPNAIQQTFQSLFDREVSRRLTGSRR